MKGTSPNGEWDMNRSSCGICFSSITELTGLAIPAMPFFGEIGQLAGIQATDWSWSVLIADFNNDGWKDMHITNGIGRDFINGDFVTFSNSIFGSDMTREQQEEEIRKKLVGLDHINLPNYLYIK